MPKLKPEPPPQAEGNKFSIEDIAVVEESLKNKYFELLKKEMQVGLGRDKKLTAEIDRIQNTLTKIRNSKS